MTPEREIEIRALLKGSLMYWPQTLGPWAAIALDLIAALDQERARAVLQSDKLKELLARVAKLERVVREITTLCDEHESASEFFGDCVGVTDIRDLTLAAPGRMSDTMTIDAPDERAALEASDG